MLEPYISHQPLNQQQWAKEIFKRSHSIEIMSPTITFLTKPLLVWYSWPFAKGDITYKMCSACGQRVATLT
jgi:hypothetical protein